MFQKAPGTCAVGAESARGRFELGYFDRVESRVIVVPLQSVDEPGVFRVMDAEG